MAMLTDKSAGGTSFHGTTLTATPQQLIDAIGEPQHGSNDGRDKTNFDWYCETEDGDVFTIYDWKEYRPLGMNEYIDFHIGGENQSVTAQAAREVLKLI